MHSCLSMQNILTMRIGRESRVPFVFLQWFRFLVGKPSKVSLGGLIAGGTEWLGFAYWFAFANFYLVPNFLFSHVPRIFRRLSCARYLSQPWAAVPAIRDWARHDFSQSTPASANPNASWPQRQHGGFNNGGIVLTSNSPKQTKNTWPHMKKPKKEIRRVSKGLLLWALFITFVLSYFGRISPTRYPVDWSEARSSSFRSAYPSLTSSCCTVVVQQA